MECKVCRRSMLAQHLSILYICYDCLRELREEE